MAVTPDELEQFQEFARRHIASGGADSLVELVEMWRANNPDEAELAESLRALEEGLQDVAAGRVSPVDEVFKRLAKRFEPDRWRPLDVLLSGLLGALFGASLPVFACILVLGLYSLQVNSTPEDLMRLATWIFSGGPLAMWGAVAGCILGIAYGSQQLRRKAPFNMIRWHCCKPQ